MYRRVGVVVADSSLQLTTRSRRFLKWKSYPHISTTPTSIVALITVELGSNTDGIALDFCDPFVRHALHLSNREQRPAAWHYIGV